MKAGELRHTVVIEYPVETRDPEFANVQKSWQEHATVRAAIEPLAGREFFQNREVQGDLTTRIRTRYVAGVTGKMRVRFGSRVFNITAVIDPEERHRELQLMCAEEA